MERAELERYARQILLKEVGGPGQVAIGKAKILIIGAGGLGGPASLYLAAAGVGNIGLIDDDVVELSNLHRQIQFQTNDLKKPKVDALANQLSALNPHISIDCHNIRLDSHNAAKLIADYDLVLDGTDSFETRFAVNAACIATKTPLISGALGRFDGQLAVFENEGTDPCYQCFVPEAPPGAETCATVGVLGALAGIIGSMMAMEALKLVTGAGTPLSGKLFIYDGLSGETRKISLVKDPSCPACSKS
jgi:molybdopterin/thiamine biosynthesis adenylyltransferase